MHRLRTSLSVPALIERLYDETRILAALTGTRRGEAQVANLEKVVVLARKASDLGVLTVRGFIRLLQERIRTAREEPDLPATRPGDPETVRILSIHKAKGLEAPVVALYDTADDYRTPVDLVPLWDGGHDRGRVPRGLPASGLGRALRAREGPCGRGGTTAPLRGLHAGARPARDPLAAEGRARGRLLEATSSRQLPARSDADVRVVDADDAARAVEREERGGELRELLGGGRAAMPRGAHWDARRGELLESAGHRPFVPAR